MPATGLKVLWTVASNTVGLRQLGGLASSLSNTFRDTVFYFREVQYPAVKGLVALTIDDGLCRSGAGRDMISEVLALLQKYGAKATFFVCSDYLVGYEERVREMVANGHELGNHCPRDRHYANDTAEEFERALLETNHAIEGILGEESQVRWFRAPQARYTARMREVVVRHGLRHALGDCYCDDWAIDDCSFVEKTMLRQAQSGSVLVTHMPERGFREHTLEALERVLRGLQERELRCVTISELVDLAEKPGSQEHQPEPSNGKRWRCGSRRRGRDAGGCPAGDPGSTVGGPDASGEAGLVDNRSDLVV